MLFFCEYNIDIGRIISKEILSCRNKKAGYLFFPYWITNLCIHVRAGIGKHEEKKSPQGPFSAEFKPKTKIAKATTCELMLQNFMLQ